MSSGKARKAEGKGREMGRAKGRKTSRTGFRAASLKKVEE
jgi:hypothetical protein